MMKQVVTCCFWHYVCIKLQNKKKTAHSDLTHIFKVKVVCFFCFFKPTHLKANSAKRFVVSSNIKVNHRVFARSWWAAAAQTCGRKHHRTEFLPVW